ncbi:MAG TPA: hypothetical protein VGX16_01900 [Solirubrobacteraceae bacterium]|jgi:hypothetical protein|nr:hypothetical protein [Solirubrobacteraceae bacterium]
MIYSIRTVPAILGTALTIALLCVLASAAGAAGTPAIVTVRVEGLGHTVVLPTQVTTTTAPVVKDGKPEDSCTGTSAAGALELATAGNWGGTWNKAFGYSVERVVEESFPFTGAYYWSLWLKDHEAETGVCGAELENGEEVLLFPGCYSESKGVCPPVAPLPLGIEAPVIAEARTPVRVTVSMYNSKGEASPAVGATVSGGGTSSTTDSGGHATLMFAGDGTYTLQVSGSSEGPPSVRTETRICVHEGNDGTCGTPAPAASSLPGSSPGSIPTLGPAPYGGPYAVVAEMTDVLDGHHYSRGHAPRVLTGKVLAHTGVGSVEIELRRGRGGHCSFYDGVRGRFERARCGRGSFFKAGSGASFSYLLPTALPAGRYVLDVEAVDANGNRTKLARGSSRAVFYVD